MELKVGDIILDKCYNNYGIVIAIDKFSGRITICYSDEGKNDYYNPFAGHRAGISTAQICYGIDKLIKYGYKTERRTDRCWLLSDEQLKGSRFVYIKSTKKNNTRW